VADTPLEDLVQRIRFAYALPHRVTVAGEARRRDREAAGDQRIANRLVVRKRDGVRGEGIAVEVEDEFAVPVGGLVDLPQRAGGDAALEVDLLANESPAMRRLGDARSL
jgi:hypothetical protein